MNINKENYEAYFLDYFEGNLTPGEISELLLFIEQYPEVRSEFDNFEAITLHADQTVTFNAKDSLKQSPGNSFGLINENNIDEFLCAELEKTLSLEESASLDTFLENHPSYIKDRVLYSFTKLEADASVVYPGKVQLRHKAIAVGSIDENNYEQIMVEYIEGTLNEQSQDTFRAFLLTNPHLNHELELFKLTQLIPDKSVVFEKKSTLKHSVVPLRRIVYYSLSAAASLALMFSLYTFWDNNKSSLKLADNSVHEQVNSATTKENAPVSTDNSTVSKGNTQQVSPPLLAEAKQEIIKRADVHTTTSTVESNKLTGQIHSMSPMACKEVSSSSHVEPEFMFIRTSQMHSNEYLELYYNIKLAEQIQYAELNAADANPEKTLLNSFASRLGEVFAFNKKQETPENTGVSVWTFAELGVKTYNNITRDNVKLDLNRDEKGEVVSYNITGDKLDFQRDIRK